MRVHTWKDESRWRSPVIEVQIIEKDSNDSWDRCSRREGFATDIFSTTGVVGEETLSLEFWGDKKEGNSNFTRWIREATMLFEMLNFPVTRNFYEVSLSATRGEVRRRGQKREKRDATESVFRRADGIIVRPLKIESFKTVEIHFLRATRAAAGATALARPASVCGSGRRPLQQGWRGN